MPPPPQQKIQTVPSVKKVIATVFWDVEGILLVDFLVRTEKLMQSTTVAHSIN
jgi:hypothetical protein